MNTSGPEFATELLFNWELPRKRRTAITAFLALSLIAHALCFYIFQVVYPPSVALLPPPARVSSITSATEEGRTLLRWIDAEAPALPSPPRRPPGARRRAFPGVALRPPYVAGEPGLKKFPPPD